MISRRLLRIKLMQALYALRQAEGSARQMALDGISGQFQPDLNSMLPQDKRQLAGYRKLATLLFEETVKTDQPAQDDDAPKTVLNAANDALTYYRGQAKRDRDRVAKQLLENVNAIYTSYLRVLLLLPELAHAAKLDRERLYPDPDETPFMYESDLSQNRVVQALAEHRPLETEAVRQGISWAENDGATFVRKAYREVLKPDETYRAYCAQSRHTADEDQALVQHLLRQLIFKSELIGEFLNEQDLGWAENSEVVRGMAIRTLKSATSAEGLKLEELTDDWESDEEFLNTLFNAALDNDAEYEQMLADQLKNWDVERVAMLDRIILKLAVAELLSFPGIPVKVSINEFIDLAKQYSTPKSGKFVNGILDSLAEKLTASGQLRKSGRGLIDNK